MFQLFQRPTCPLLRDSSDSVIKSANNTVDNSVSNTLNNNKNRIDKNRTDKKKLSIESKESTDKPCEGTTKRTAFVVPSLEIVKDYFSTIKGGDTDAECFYDYFTANGWRTGKNPVKDWKAAARNWMRRKSEFSNTTQNQTNHETKRIYQDL